MAESHCMFDTPAASERPWQKVAIGAPRADRTWVAAPELSQAAELARQNHKALEAVEVSIQGRNLNDLRQWTRREVLREAREYTSGLVDGDEAIALAADPPDPAHATFYVGGHQPALFHPGVWVKNFVVGGMARAEGGIGLNLVVDNDAMSSTAIRVPVGTRAAPRVELTPFDEPRPVRPWEEARIIDRSLFDSFAARVDANLSPWGVESLLGAFWPAAVRHARRTDRLAECLTAARNQWERRWGNRNLELPLSRLCRLEPFLWFASHILAHLPRFHALYNEVLHEYRTVNRLRSRTHPVPDLREEEGWFEAPFWIWEAGDHVRRRLLARQEAGTVLLSNGLRTIAELPLAPNKDGCCAVEALRKLQDEGWRLRTRALTTTLFARLCLADLFVHGLGGAKYDEMTDRLFTRFFCLPAPGFLTLTATVRLPLKSFAVQPEDESRLRRQLRELDFHSERHLPPSPSPAWDLLVAEKARLVAAQQAMSAHRRRDSVHCEPLGELGGYERYRRLQEVNRRLAEHTRSARQGLSEELTRTVDQLAANAILGDREYAFCLYPAETLRRFMDHVCSALGT
jgi:hypothetical protein